MYKLVFCFALLFCLAGVAHAEQISDFSAVLDVQEDGTVVVTETITYDFGATERHGIYRTLQEQHPQKNTVWYKKRSIAIEVLEVLKDGVDEPYQITDKRTEVEVKIGSADVTISGVHTYTLRFKLNGALSYGKQGSELYYNVTGNNWLVPIEKANAIVTDSTGQLLKETRTCYQGVYGDTTRCTMDTQTATSSTFTTGLLTPGTGLTVAQELNADQVAVLINEEVRSNWIGYVLGILCVLVIGISAYRYRTHFKLRRTVVAQYHPYESVLPMYTGLVFDGKLDARDITAGIIYLAQQGFIKIQKVELKVLLIFDTSDYIFELTRLQKEMDNPFLSTILSVLFPEEAEIGSIVTLTTLKTDSARQAENAVLLAKLRKDIKADLYQEGYFQLSRMWVQILILLFGGIALVSFFATAEIVTVVPAEIFFFSIFILVCIFVGLLFMYERRTGKGYETLNYLKGFKLFLSVTEKERYKFFNAPEKSPEQFMEYLPYAIAFGVEKEWSKVFEGITIPNPSWYEGGAVGAFSATSFASDIGTFSSSFAASSGVSGSSGGGSSGGGGGGGGGGSW